MHICKKLICTYFPFPESLKDTTEVEFFQPLAVNNKIEADLEQEVRFFPSLQHVGKRKRQESGRQQPQKLQKGNTFFSSPPTLFLG